MTFRIRPSLVLLVPLLLAARPAVAQRVEGTVTDAQGRPVAGALVMLFDTEGRRRHGALSGEAGQFTLHAPGAGTWEVRAERVGLQTARAAGVTLLEGEVRSLALRMGAAPVALEGVAVTGRSRCGVRAGQGAETATLWEEARKALNNAAWTEERQAYRYEAALFQRDLEPAELAVLREERRTGVSVGRSPFRSVPAAELSRHGYSRQMDGGVHYYAPDAAVLLSDEFLNDHCFRVVAGTEGDEAGMVGLAFEPVGGRRVPEVQGVLWMRRDSASLKHLEYRYLNLDVDVPTDRLGGRVDFERLPSGSWIVRRWWIRMPSVGLEEQVVPGQGSRRSVSQTTQRLWGIREEGGEVTRVLNRNGTPIVTVARGTVSGVVWDEGSAAPLPGARVFVSGTQFAATSDAEGRFRIEGVPEGTYTMGFFHDGAASRGAVPAVARVAVGEGDTAAVRLTLAPPPPPLPGERVATARQEAAPAPVMLPRRLSAAAPSAAHSERMAAFHRRAAGGAGRFFTRADLDALRPARAADIFRSVPQVEVVGATVRHRRTGIQGARGAAALSADRGGFSNRTDCGNAARADLCTAASGRAGPADCPAVFVDGTLADAGGDLSAIDPDAIEGVEVYPRPALAPAEYRRIGPECAVILIWLREGTG